MKPSDTVKVGMAIAMLVGAGALLAAWLSGPAEGDGEDVTCWSCTDSACGKEFTKGTLELARLRSGQPDANPACPACGKATTVRCVPCPHCGAFLRPVAHGQLPKTCTKCQRPTVASSTDTTTPVPPTTAPPTTAAPPAGP